MDSIVSSHVSQLWRNIWGLETPPCLEERTKDKGEGWLDRLVVGESRNVPKDKRARMRTAVDGMVDKVRYLLYEVSYIPVGCCCMFAERQYSGWEMRHKLLRLSPQSSTKVLIRRSSAVLQAACDGRSTKCCMLFVLLLVDCLSLIGCVYCTC